jgi:hypothetical protein
MTKSYTDNELETIIKFGEDLKDIELNDAIEQAKKYVELRKIGLRQERETDKEIQNSVKDWLKRTNRVKKDYKVI